MKKWPSSNNLSTKGFMFALEKKIQISNKCCASERERRKNCLEDETHFPHMNIVCKVLTLSEIKRFFLQLHENNRSCYLFFFYICKKLFV